MDEVGKRLREFREKHLFISRTRFAIELGIGSERLASYEAGRHPLKYEVFRLIGEQFELNPAWLATGEGAVFLDGPFNDKFLGERAILLGKKPFLEVFEKELKGRPELIIADVSESAGRFNGKLNFLIENFLSDVSPDAKKVCLDSLRIIIKKMDFILHHLKSTALKFEGESGQGETRNLTSCQINPLELNCDAMTMSQLLNRVAQTVQGHGKKADLARFLGVSQQRVYEWLAGVKEPGGENTLLLLKWALKAEAKQKSPESADTLPERKAQRKNIKYEKSTSSRKKK